MAFEDVELGHKLGKEEFEQREEELRVELLNLQFDLKSSPLRVLIVLAGDDREGLGDLMDLAHEWLDARLLQTGVFSDRENEETEYPAFWRYWRAMPARGRIGVFYGGWPMGPIADRILDRISKKEYAHRVRHGQQLERMLADDGMLILKFWLHVPKKQLKKRLRSARKSQKSWRRMELHQLILDRYDDLTKLGESLVQESDAPHAPWLVVESTDDEYRNLTVMETVRAAIAERLATPAAEPPRVTAQSPAGDEDNVLDGIDLTQTLEHKDYGKRLDELQARLADLTLAARDKNLSTVLAFEGWDAAGKGGAIRRITRAISIRDYRVVPIAAPTEEELAHHYLWRFWRRIPRDGHMTIFDRSWYGRVLVERVEGYATPSEWSRAYGEIVDFETQLAEHGTLVRKFWLHIDPDEQLRRFQARETTPYKKHKITKEDYRNRDRWAAYAEAVHEMVTRTDTEHAPWTLVAANDKRHARIAVLEELCSALAGALAE